jgi:hypothetical protein
MTIVEVIGCQWYAARSYRDASSRHVSRWSRPCSALHVMQHLDGPLQRQAVSVPAVLELRQRVAELQPSDGSGVDIRPAKVVVNSATVELRKYIGLGQPHDHAATPQREHPHSARSPPARSPVRGQLGSHD